MSIAVRMVRGTPTDPALPLCARCKNSWATRDSQGRTQFRCNLTGPAVLRQKIVECTAFYPSQEPWLWEYESLAWVWASGPTGAPAFVRLRDLETPGIAVGPRTGF